MPIKTKPRIALIGPIFDTPSGPSGQGGKLYEHLKQQGFEVSKKSAYRNKILRMLDTLFFVFFKKNEFDIILLQSFGLLAFVMEDAVSRLAIAFKKPIVFTLRGGAFLEFYAKHVSWVHKVLNRVTCITTPSLFLQKHLEEKGFSINYIPNFVNLKEFPFARNVELEHSVLWVRAFHDIYNPELAIETIFELKKKFKDVHLTMIGPDQGSLEACKKLISTLDLNDSITILGFIPNKELFSFYQSHQVFITTTRYESFGVAIIEAASCGIPQVSTKVGEIPFLWAHNENMLLADRDAKDFAKNIESFFCDENLRTKISENAYKKAQEFAWEHVQQHYWNLLNKLSVA